MRARIAPDDHVGDYVVEAIIGEGGMAVVARAAHKVYHHRVAIKMLTAGVARSPEVVKRFEREQRTLLRLESEHSVRCFGGGVHEGLPYMVLELLEGRDLDQRLKQEGPLEPQEAVPFILQACHAIAEAHARGIVHRDLKPSNLFLTRRHDGSACVKVLDFGISKVTNSPTDEPTLTKTKMVVGSPYYMSPEQLISSKDTDARTDIWSLGVTLYELLTKSLPFAAATTDDVVRRVLHGEPTPLRKLRPLIPGGLEAIVMRCLRRRPEERWPNVADFAQRLSDFGPEHGRFALAQIYALVPPSERDAMRASIADLGPAMGPREHDQTTVYLRQEEPSTGGTPAWMTAAFAATTFALGAGLGWAMTLDTDPTAGPRARPVTISSAPAPAPPPAPARARAEEDPDEDEEPPHNPLDLDELPVAEQPPAASPRPRPRPGPTLPPAVATPRPSAVPPAAPRVQPPAPAPEAPTPPGDIEF